MTLDHPGNLYLTEAVLAELRGLSGGSGNGTVDELGFGPLYDRVAAELFPWCSTLTSRARYFFFSYAVIDLALEFVAGPHACQTWDPARLKAKAQSLVPAFNRRLVDLERHLALSLVYVDKTENGIFGVTKATAWLRDDTIKVGSKGCRSVLSDLGRYPNAVYRGSCARLNMFFTKTRNSELIAAYLQNQSPFRENWEAS